MDPSISLRGKRVVVTGGCGFIGSHLVERLFLEGVEDVLVLDSMEYGNENNLSALSRQPRVVRFNIGRDAESALTEYLRGSDVLIHLAAEKHNQSISDPDKVLAANVVGTRALFETAARLGVKKIIFTSSLYAYGRSNPPAMVETELPIPSTVYGVSKLAGEHLLRYVAKTYGTPWVVLRLFFIYGPRQFAGTGYKSVIVKNFERMLRRLPPIICGDGTQALDYVYVDDAIEAIVRSITRPCHGEVMNVATCTPVRVIDLVDTMAEVAGWSGEREFAPPDATAGTVRIGDSSKMEALLGFKTSTPLRDGLARTFRWIREHDGVSAEIVI